MRTLSPASFMHMRAPRNDSPTPSGHERSRFCLPSMLSLPSQLILGFLSAVVISAAVSVARAPSRNSQNGKHIFETQGCQQCHGNQGQGLANTQTQESAPRIGPTRLSQAAFVGFVRHPMGKMPAYRNQDVSDAELADLYAFLQSLAPPTKADPSSANATKGQHLFMSYGCYECHGNEGQGSTQTAGSRIGPIEIPFAPFVAYIRQPTAQMPPYTAKAVSDADLADIYAFLVSRPHSTPAKSIQLLNQ